MKKLIIIALCILSTNTLFAQAVVLKDTVFMSVPQGVSVDMHDTLLNPTNAPIPQIWNISNTTILPVGFTVSSICTAPYPTGGLGQCVNYTFAPHPEDTIPANGGIDYKTSVSVGMNAVGNSMAYVVVKSSATGGKNMVFAIKALEFPTSIKPVLNVNNITVYPTPASTVINLVHNSSLVSKATIFNVIGKKIMTYNTPVGEKGFSMPVSELSNGIYFIELQDKNGAKLALKKFVKN
jgi:hypothetical protein